MPIATFMTPPLLAINLLSLLLAAGPGPSPDELPISSVVPVVVEARLAPLAEATFDPELALSWEPEPAGLAGRMRQLLEASEKDGYWLTSLVRELEPVRSDKRAAKKIIERRLDARADLDETDRELLEQLLREDQLLGDWDPDTDDDRDAIAQGDERLMPATTEGREAREVYQAVALVRADLTTLKRAENDHRETEHMIGVVYEQLSLVEGSLLRGEDEALGPFAALKIDFTMDVPWPFGSIDARVHSLSRLDRHGHLVTDVYATGEDVLWFEGRDVFLPLLDEHGECEAVFVVRSLGFDMAGLPDFEFAQRHGITAGLGNLKRMAEKAWAKRGEGPVEPHSPESIPRFGVIRQH
jgi:hypothetical protein